MPPAGIQVGPAHAPSKDVRAADGCIIVGRYLGINGDKRELHCNLMEGISIIATGLSGSSRDRIGSGYLQRKMLSTSFDTNQIHALIYKNRAKILDI